MNPAELLRDLPSLAALFERTYAKFEFTPGWEASGEADGRIRLTLARALVEAAELGASDPAPQTVKVVYEPPAGSVGVDVEDLAKGGVKLTVSVRRPREDGETWDEVTEHAARVAAHAYRDGRRHFPREGA